MWNTRIGKWSNQSLFPNLWKDRWYQAQIKNFSENRWDRPVFKTNNEESWYLIKSNWTNEQWQISCWIDIENLGENMSGILRKWLTSVLQQFTKWASRSHTGWKYLFAKSITGDQRIRKSCSVNYWATTHL